MKALISSIEPRQTGYRVCQVCENDKIFPVADSMQWVDCDDTVKADMFWYDPADQTIKPNPQNITEE
jgi:hypothetical protein